MASLGPDTAYQKYDVFISCRTEVLKIFFSHVYHRLLPHGLRVFTVNEESEVPLTEDIIRTATLHIPIFCPDYTKSRWCLNELVLMWESKKPIIPVFYHVSPAQIRRSGSHGATSHDRPAGIETLFPRTDEDTMGKWRNALTKVTGIDGFVLDDYNRDEGQLVSQVVERVLKMLKDNLDYDVFINHRGPDVKKTLASYLYHCLVAHGLRVFLDIEEMQEGVSLTSQIKGAIRTAFIHIAIFSSRYAESSWCLDELVLMLESGSTIIPIFHTVKPSDLTSETGKYAQQLCDLEKKTDQEGKPRYDLATITKWKTALSDVDKSTEFDLEHYHSDEGLLADVVMQRVLSEEVKLWENGDRPRCCAT